MKRGAIYWVNLEPTSPPEFGKVRPGLIVSNTEQNVRLPTVVILPFSSRSPEIWPLRLEFKIHQGKTSYVVIPGIRQVNKARLEGMIDLVPHSFLSKVDEALFIYLKD